MGLLDKLKPQPRWKNTDPLVRLDALRELEDPVELALLAETDPDARVRRAAIVRVSDPATLGRISAGDADEEARDRAAETLVQLATTAKADEATAIAAIRQLSDSRRLSAIARGDSTESVCEAALARTTDERALGSIARHAVHERIARLAADRLTGREELVEVALGSAHRDVALLAFERTFGADRDPAALRSVEARAQQKAVAKRARAILIEIEEAEAARRAAEEARRQRDLALCAELERVATIADPAGATEALARVRATRDATELSDDLMPRFDRALDAARTAIAARIHEAEQAAEEARARAEALASCDALTSRVETLDGDHLLEQLASIEEEWRSLTPLVGHGPDADRLAERFALAVAACRKRHERSAVAAETRARLETLVSEAEGLASKDDAATATRWQAVGAEARGLTAILEEAGRPAAELVARLDAVEAAFAARQTARLEAAARAQQEVTSRLQRLIDRARRVSEADTITLREGDRLMRDLSTGLEEAAKSTHARDLDASVDRLRQLQEAIAPRVRELREMDEWRRFANAQQQEKLIAMAEAIVVSLKGDAEAGKPSDLAATARALKELHAKWQEVAEAPRQSAQRLWDRFRLATDFIRSVCETYFAQVRQEQGVNLEKKRALAEEAESLASSSDWARATQRFQEMQQAWQDTGQVPRQESHELTQRFRAASALFFGRRREDLVQRKKTWSDNMVRKEALCARAETLAESTDWEAAGSEMKRLQAEWKTIGPVRRNRSEAIWNRFRAAADRFFERFHNRHQITISTKLAEREALVVDLEGLAALDAADAPADLAARVDTLRSTWNRSVPIPAAEMTPLNDRWRAAFAAVLSRHPAAFAGSDLDADAIVERMRKLVAKVEALVKDVREPETTLSQTEQLAAKLRSAFATNAMGGRASEDARWRAAADAVKDAQSAWQRIVPVDTPEARALDTRFREACRRVLDRVRREGTSQANRSRRPERPSTAAAV